MSGKKITRKQQAERTKLQLFEVALALLEDRDFEDIKVRDIVKAAGVSIGSFYNYYSSKMDVFYETYQLADEYFDQTVEPLLKQDTIHERILYFFDYYAKYSSEITNIKLTKILYNSNNTYFDRRSDIGMRPTLIRLVKDGFEKGELYSDYTAEELADFLLIAARGLVYNWCTSDASYNLSEAMHRYVSTLLKSLD